MAPRRRGVGRVFNACRMLFCLCLCKFVRMVGCIVRLPRAGFQLRKSLVWVGE